MKGESDVRSDTGMAAIHAMVAMYGTGFPPDPDRDPWVPVESPVTPF